MTDMSTYKKHILMVGPDRSVHGGISGVVNGYYEAGLDEMVDLRYIGTMKEGSKVRKLVTAMAAYLRYRTMLSWADVVHVHVASDNSFRRKSVFIRAAHTAGKRMIIHQHGGDLQNWFEQGNRKRQKMMIDVLNMADRIIVISDAYRDIVTSLAVDDDKVTAPVQIMPNAIDTKRYTYAEHKETGRNLLFMGRICRAKGVGELIGAVTTLSEEYPDLKLTLGGIWEDEDLKERIRPISDRTEVIGWLGEDDKIRVLNSCDIFVLPSYFEGQSVTILEAMAAGCLVVASDVGGIPMMISDDVTGILIRPQDEQSLTDALRRVLSDDYSAERSRICAAARKLVCDEYDIRDYMSRLMDIYMIE